jgi:uncharacterized membrane protein
VIQLKIYLAFCLFALGNYSQAATICGEICDCKGIANQSSPETENGDRDSAANQSGTDSNDSDTATANSEEASPEKPQQDEEKAEDFKPLITNDAVIFGILMVILAVVFVTSNSNNRFLKAFYTYIPMLLLCYFLPSLLSTFKIVDGEKSKLYFVATRFLLPACLVLLTISVDLKEILQLGPKALILFLTGTLGVVIGGPLAVLLFAYIAPEIVGGVGPDAAWRGLSTVAGSWIGGAANQASMQAVFEPSDELFTTMVTVDVLVAEVWMAFLLIGVGHSKRIDAWFKADASSIEELKLKMEKFSASVTRVPTTTDIMVILGIAFGITGACHIVADLIAPAIKTNFPYLSRLSLDSDFFWLIVLSTTIGLCLSFTKLRNYEGAGASRIGTVFIFILVATIGMKLDVTKIWTYRGYFAVGAVWMLIHVILLIVVAWAIRAPYFFLAVGSKANIGGAASAPVLAGAFHPSLAPVGVLLAVLGYALGTYGAYICALMMKAVSPTQ